MGLRADVRHDRCGALTFGSRLTTLGSSPV
jgi:hypothetical protein